MTNNISQAYKQLALNAKSAKPGKNLQYIPDPYKNVAKGMEKQFAEFMVKQMNKTVGGPENEGTGTNYYKSLLTSERANAMTDNNGGLGLQNVILDQIYPERMRNEFSYKRYLAQKEANEVKREKIDMPDTNKSNAINMYKKNLDQAIEGLVQNNQGVKDD
jgi:Rod binding domain-containing protein